MSDGKGEGVGERKARMVGSSRAGRKEKERRVTEGGEHKANFMSYIANRLQSTITCMSHHLLAYAFTAQ